MTKSNEPAQPLASRREFLKTSAAATAGTMASLGVIPAVHAGGSDAIKVGIIGCGGRGSGTAENVLQAAKGVEIVALGDYFKEDERRGVEPLRQRLMDFSQNDAKVKELGNKGVVPLEHCYTGLDAYERVINTPGVNYIILATPPGFRPLHLAAAIAAGKHIFTEKPVAVDGPGIRQVLAADEEAKKKRLGIAAGTQRRHQLGYLETMKRIHGGAIGDIVGGRCYWNQSAIWFRPRKNGMSNLDYQIHNWYHFAWLSGDHIVEQHVHNIDVINWATGSHPIKAVGMGGRALPCNDPNVDGNIYNFFAIDYEYPKAMHVLSMCRQVNNCENNNSEVLIGTKGTCQANAYMINGKRVVNKEQEKAVPVSYVQEHTDLIESIRTGRPINELKNIAESTLTAIMGRMSAYTGKLVTWESALGSMENLMPDKFDSLPVAPVAVPGQTRLT